ncbi:hypothetical protein [Halomontanus rarus]|uniref:hypothetical protein n=1 Tax=Halomontanus rarus TaxID=3034020 RepID=UPI001F622FA2
MAEDLSHVQRDRVVCCPALAHGRSDVIGDIVPSNNAPAIDRRTLLASLAGTVALAGCSAFEQGEDGDTMALADDRARELAERFAPTLYFDEHEQWFPTDPRPYATDRDGETVVDGFAAFDGYTEQSGRSDGPPTPTLFYHAVRYEDSPLAVVQYWYYSAFDQFTTNFHWHDWEVLHVFVDTDSGDPQLFVASSHSGAVPNNEFLDPEPDRVPRILSELGSHSSALSINDVADRFQRLPIDGTFADITNSAVEGIEDFANVPVAYGLPRDEGSRLPYLVPELDGVPIYDHERLPSVDREDLVTDDLTVRSFADLSSPPGDLPGRATGLVFQHAGRDADADVEYELVPSSELEHVAEFTGPQLSFEFAVPEFAEDAIANHITTTGVPWDQPRYDGPAADISDPNHRIALADRYDVIGEPAPINTVVIGVTEAITSDDAPENEGLTTRKLPVEAVALLESEPEAVPTFGGVAVVQNVPEGEHRLTVNGPGVEPHSETVAVADDDEPTPAGVDGEVPLVARENATKLEVDTEGTDAELTDLVVEDDFAGQLYDAPLSGPDAVYVHRNGAYTTEVRDADDEIGAFRVNPADEARVRIDEPRTGKGPLAEYLADVAEETSAAVAAVADHGDGDESDTTPDTQSNGDSSGNSGNAVGGLARALEAVAEAARRAADRAADGDRGRADRSLANVRDRLDHVETRLAEASENLPDDIERATDRRLEQSRRRSEQARDAEKL